MTPKQTYTDGSAPTIGSLYGDYDVKVLSGLFKYYPSNVWYKNLSLVNGYNYVDGAITGHFDITFFESAVEFSYAVPKNNGSFWKYMLDFVRTTEDPDVFIGKIFVKLFSKYRGVGYFSLTKRK